MSKQKPVYLIQLAQMQKTLIWLILLIVLGILGAIGAIIVSSNTRGSVVLFGSVGLFIFVLQLLAVIQAFRLTILMRENIIYPIIMVLGGFIIPLLGLIMLLVINNKATKELKLAGATVGFMGVPSSEYPRFLPGHCRSCGYDRSGLASDDACPECGERPHRSAYRARD